MTRTFPAIFYLKREFVVDERGISELRSGTLAVFVPWEQVVRIDNYGARGESGTKVSLRLNQKDRSEFRHFATDEWRKKQPERWQRNRDCLAREADWAAYFWIPLFTFGPCALCYLLFWHLGFPKYLDKEIQTIHRLTLMSAIFAIAAPLYYTYAKRKGTLTVNSPDDPAQ